MPMTQDEMVKLLEKHSFMKVKGGRDSHVKMTKFGQQRPIIIPKGTFGSAPFIFFFFTFV